MVYQLLNLQAGVDINAQRLFTAAVAPNLLSATVKHNTVEILQFMLEGGADIKTFGGEAVRAAAKQGNIEAVQILILSDADVNPPTAISKLTVLQNAVLNGNIETVKILLDAGSDVNASVHSVGMQTALHTTVMVGVKPSPQRLEIVRILLAAVADVNHPQKEQNGASILQSTVIADDEKLVQILLKEGADVNSPPRGEN